MALLDTRNSNIRFYSAVLVEMLNSIRLQRLDGLYLVPVTVESYDAHNRRDMEEELDSTRRSLELPAISIKFVDIMYDSSRALNKMNRKVHMNFGNTRAIITYEDIPVTLNFNITIQAKTINDIYTLIEFIQSEFKHNLVRKRLSMPLYDGGVIVTPMSLNGITFEDELDMEEGREISAQINMNINGVIHSYLNGLWGDVLRFYRQMELIDSDGDGIIDSYLHPITKEPVVIGSEEDDMFTEQMMVYIADELGVPVTDILTKPEFSVSNIGDALIQKVLLRIWENNEFQQKISEMKLEKGKVEMS